MNQRTLKTKSVRRLGLLIAAIILLVLSACGEDLSSEEAQAISGGGNSAYCPQTITSTFVGGNGGYGNMFDVVVGGSNLFIESMDVNDNNASGITAPIEMYYKAGSYFGNETNSGAWTMLGSGTITSNGPGVPTPLPFAVNLTLTAGQVYGIYITKTDSTILDYTNGTSELSVYADDGNLSILEGIGTNLPIFSVLARPRVWNGNIHYNYCV